MSKSRGRPPGLQGSAEKGGRCLPPGGGVMYNDPGQESISISEIRSRDVTLAVLELAV